MSGLRSDIPTEQDVQAICRAAIFIYIYIYIYLYIIYIYLFIYIYQAVRRARAVKALRANVGPAG